MIALDQQDGAGAHTDRDGELLGHRAEQLVKVERGRKIGGHASEPCRRRREMRQAALSAAGAALTEHDQQSDQQREGADRRQA